MTLHKDKVEKFISACMVYKGDRYSQPYRLKKGYSDCSSIIQKGGASMGLWGFNDTVTTRGIRDGDKRFYQISFKDLQRGDILWWQKPNIKRYEGHVGVYLGDGKVLEAIYAGVLIKDIKRLAWQRVYRVKALETVDTVKVQDKVKKGVILAANKKGKVNTNVLNVRDVDGTQGDIIDKVKLGDILDITGETTNGWYQIVLRGRKGYVSGKYVDIVNVASDWAKDSVDKLVKAGVSDGSRLQEPITREEVLVMIDRALKL